MSELAFNLNGEPFELPAEATGWRVRRMKTKGAPEVVYGHNGVPLILPLDAELADVRAETGAAGRYRLDPVDENNRPIANAPAGYIYLHETEVVPHTAIAPGTDNVVIEAMRMNTEIAKSVVDRFPQMIEAAASLLRAADGAGLPSRPGTVIDATIDVEDAEEEPTPGFDFNAFIQALMPHVMGAVMGGKAKVPDIASVLDWRKAAKPAAKAKLQPEVEKKSMPSLEPAQMAHVLAIQQAMNPDEVAFVQEVAKDLSPAELRDWFDKLSKQSVPDAVATIRGLIAGKQEGAS